jgi:predicted aspartyl protease
MPQNPLSSPSPPDRIYIRNTRIKFSTHVQVQLRTLDTGAKIDVSALLDSGATGLFLDTRFVREANLNTRKLPRAIPVYNVDGTLNQGGSILEEVEVMMHFKDHTEKTTFAVCDLGEKAAIIGHTWLSRHNPEIDWQTGEVTLSRCPPSCHVQVKSQKKQKKARTRRGRLPPILEEDEEEILPDDVDTEDRIFVTFLYPEERICATSTVSQRMAEESQKHDSQKKTFEEDCP